MNGIETHSFKIFLSDFKSFLYLIRKKRGIYPIWLLLSQCIDFPGMRKIPSNKNVKDKGLSETSIVDIILFNPLFSHITLSKHRYYSILPVNKLASFHFNA